jgi:hypothetical protein
MASVSLIYTTDSTFGYTGRPKESKAGEGTDIQAALVTIANR